jgi:hypothetical protein
MRARKTIEQGLSGQILYHGGGKRVAQFNIPSYGVFFSPHKSWAKNYGQQITAVRVHADRVYIVDYSGEYDDDIVDALFDRDYSTLARFVSHLSTKGYQALQTVTDSEMVCVFPGTRIEIVDDNGATEGASWKQETLSSARITEGRQMNLSHVQRVIVAQLYGAKDNPSACYTIIRTNPKAVQFSKLLEQSNVIVVNETDETAEVNEEKLKEIAEKNDLVDEMGELTETGQELLDATIKESVLTRVLRYASS